MKNNKFPVATLVFNQTFSFCCLHFRAVTIGPWITWKSVNFIKAKLRINPHLQSIVGKYNPKLYQILFKSHSISQIIADSFSPDGSSFTTPSHHIYPYRYVPHCHQSLYPTCKWLLIHRDVFYLNVTSLPSRKRTDVLMDVLIITKMYRCILSRFHLPPNQ